MRGDQIGLISVRPVGGTIYPGNTGANMENYMRPETPIMILEDTVPQLKLDRNATTYRKKGKKGKVRRAIAPDDGINNEE